MTAADGTGEAQYEVRRRGWFSQFHDIKDPAGNVIGSLEIATGFVASAVARAGNRVWNFRQQWRSFSIAGDGIVGKAQPIGWLDPELELHLGDRSYWIKPASWGHAAVVRDRAGTIHLWFQPRFIMSGGNIGFSEEPDEQARLLALFTYFHHVSRSGD